jgi:4-amino-4-deoxy-L-arabinose transferase-like glycosyltransferase
MFMDAVLYSSVAHNLAQGIGTFWHPVFSAVSHWNLPKTFHEQPPLGFYIQSVFYRITGNGWLGERLYTLLMLIITTALIAGFWKYIFRDDTSERDTGWLPILIWITIPVCFWSYRNDMCENTMGVFTLAAIWLLYKNMSGSRPAWFIYILSGILIFLASLTKGFPGLFPLSFPVLYVIAIRRHSLSHAIIASLVLTITVSAIYGLVLLNPAAYDSLHIYFFDRLLVRVATDPTVGNHFSIVWSLIQELMVPIILCVLAGIYYRVFAIEASRMQMQLSLLFLLLGLAGTLPLMLTRVQKAFYGVAALPCFAMAAAFYLSAAARLLVNFIVARHMFYTGLLYIGLLSIIAVIIISGTLYGQVYRDPGQLHDVHIISQYIPRGSEVAVSSWLDVQFSFSCYLMRYDGISTGTDINHPQWRLSEKSSPISDTAFQKLDWGLIYADVYERRK